MKQLADSRLKVSTKPKQGQLFNDRQFDTSEKSPGEMSMDEWVETQDPVYHGSFRSDFDRAPVAHFGSMGQAVSRLDSSAKRIKGSLKGRDSYYNPGSVLDGDYDDYETDETPIKHTGRVYARRLTEKPMRGVLTDEAANAAEMGYRYENHEEEWEIPGSIKESAGTSSPILEYDEGGWGNPKASHVDKTAAAGQRALSQGRPIKYRNFIEGENPVDHHIGTTEDVALTSYTAPSSATRSWERDVLSTPTASPMSQQFAQQRINQGKEGAVPFPSPHVTRQPEQPQLPIYYDENERKDGAGVNSTHRWHQITGKADRPEPAKRSWVSEIQFEA